MNRNQMRQGDVFINPIDALPKGLKRVKADNGRAILAYGEVTGHAHALAYDEVELYEKDGTLYMKVNTDKGADLKHEEHGTITIPDGLYEVTRQQEYSPEEIRNVAD